MLRLLAGLAVALALSGCDGSSTRTGGTILIAVNAPFSKTPSLGETIAQGVELAAASRVGVRVGNAVYRVKVEHYDNALSPRRAVDNVRQAVRDGAVAIVDEGTGVDASWKIARDAGVPLCIVYQGGGGLVDPETRPNVFRISPTDRGVAFRLAEYLIPKRLKVALLTDDSGYGEEGRHALATAFGHNPGSVATRLRLPSTALDLAPQVLRARRSGATALLVWAQPASIAAVLTAARSSGWDVPVYAPPSGESPLIRQQLADHPRWVDGLTFATGRMTAELGPASFLAFERTYESAYGPDRVGVRTRAGREVVQPPDEAMYGYDFVNVLLAAIARAGTVDGGDKIVAALDEVTVRGANGDERGFNRKNHEGVVDDDVYFARFRDMTFRPVKDDPLSSTLPVVSQVR